MITGAALSLITLFGMIVTFQNMQPNISASSSLAEGISASLFPSQIGGCFFVIGLVLFLVGWLRGRKDQRLAA